MTIRPLAQLPFSTRMFGFLLIVAAVSPAALPAQDTQAPMLTSISLSPANVDVTTGDQTLTVTLDITDNESGFESGNVYLYRPGGFFVDSLYFNSDELKDGNDLDGTYDVEIVVPQYAQPATPPETWSVGVVLRDQENRRREYGPGEEPFPDPGDENFTLVNTGTVDTTAPQITSMSVAPGTIDTSTLAQDITIDITITDDLSGFEAVSFSFFGPSGSQNTNIFGYIPGTSVITGDILNGTYQTTVSIPAGSAAGTWSIWPYLRDRAGNTRSVSGAPGSTFEVTNTGGGLLGDLSDATDATQYFWTTTGDADWFIQDATTVDGIDAAQSGAITHGGTSAMEVAVTGPGTLSFHWKVDSESVHDVLSVSVDGLEEDTISGNIDWAETSVSIPPGTHTVLWSYSKDGSASVGADAGWVDRVKFLGDADTQDPVLQYVSISPNPVDISSGDVELTVTVEITDDFNGVSDAYVEVFDENNDSYNGNTFYLVSGDANCGIYEAIVSISEEDFFPDMYYQLGTWRLEVYVEEADTFNGFTYSSYSGEPFPIPNSDLFTVGDGFSGGDTTAPFLTSIDSIVPNPVDVSTGSQSVTATFSISDNSSGFSDGFVFLESPSGFVESVNFDLGDQISGSGPNDGTYEIVIPIPEYGPPGAWDLGFVLYDQVGNERQYPYDTSFPNPGDELFDVINTGTADTEDPVLQSISITPNAIDPGASMQSIDVSFTLTDNLSGLGSVFLYIYDPTDTDVGSLFSFFNGAGATSQTFMKTLDIPQGSMEGTWELGVFVRDRVGNWVRYGQFGDPFPVPGANEFTVGPLSPSTFGNFVSGFGLTGPDAQPGANPDKDLFSNALELLLGLNPTIPNPPDPALLMTYKTDTELRLDFTIDPSLTVQVAGDSLEVSAGGAAPVTVIGQTGANLDNNWANQRPSPVTGTTYRVSLPIASGPEGFVRLGLTVP